MNDSLGPGSDTGSVDPERHTDRVRDVVWSRVGRGYDVRDFVSEGLHLTDQVSNSTICTLARTQVEKGDVGDTLRLRRRPTTGLGYAYSKRANKGLLHVDTAATGQE